MTYKHLTIIERLKLEDRLSQGHSQTQISSALGFSKATYYREISRCPKGRYNAFQAQEHYETQKSKSGSKSKLTETTKWLFEHLIINETWSPEQVSGRSDIAFKTIYNWIHKGLLSVPKSALRRKGKPPKSKETRGKIKSGKSIEERPETINNRREFGHWELDTVVSQRGVDKTCLATFAERKTRQYLALKIPDRTSESMFRAVSKAISSYPQGTFKSFTCDNGKEFSGFKAIEDNFRVPVYFAHPYSSWERGTNENHNGLLREFFPKKTNFKLISDLEIEQATQLINRRPRKVLDFKSAQDMFNFELSHLI